MSLAAEAAARREASLATLRAFLPYPVGVGQATLEERIEPLPAEAAGLRPTATPQRRREFALGRLAARRALADLGAPTGPVLAGEHGQPLWPEGVVGAITHTGDLALALVGWSRHFAGLGVDLEAGARTLSPAARRFICTPAEDAAGWTRYPRDALRLFSAKESVFKACYPLAGVYLGFQDAAVEGGQEPPESETQSVTLVLARAVSVAHPVGTRLRVLVTRTPGYVLTATYLPAT